MKDVKTNEFLTSDFHLDLDNAFQEISTLYYTYGKEKDEMLTDDAKELKHNINQFIEKIKNL